MYLCFRRKKKCLPEPSSKSKAPDSFGEGGHLQPAWLPPFGLKHFNSSSLKLHLFFFPFRNTSLTSTTSLQEKKPPPPFPQWSCILDLLKLSVRKKEKKTFNGSRRPLTVNIFIVNLFTCLKSKQKTISNKSIIRTLWTFTLAAERKGRWQ